MNQKDVQTKIDVILDNFEKFKLKIKKDDGRYAVVFFASGFEEERFYPDQDEIAGVLKRSRLIDSLLINPTAHRFTTEFIEIGSEIYRLFLKPFTKLGEFINHSISRNTTILINIQTNDHDISRLPWELLYSPEYQFIATSPRFQIIRTIGDNGDNSRELSAGPLRILFMACSPDGTEPLLNYEKEEEIILDAVAELKRKRELEIDLAEGGTLEELKEMLANKELGRLLYKEDITWESLKEKLAKVAKEMREFTIFEQLYNFLSMEEQGFFRKVSVYQGPVGLDGIKVQEPDDSKARDYIKRLVDYSLLQQYEDNIYDIEYFQVHPLNKENIREEWWQQGEKEKAHQDAAGYYLSFEDTGFNVETLSEAVYHLRSGKMYNQMAALIAEYARDMNLKGFCDEVIYLNQIILEEKGSVPKKFLGIAYNNIGVIYYNKGEWDSALEYHLKAERIRIEVGDRAGLGTTYNNIGAIYHNKGEWDRALEYYLKAEKIEIEVGDRVGLAFTYFNIGTIYLKKKNKEKGYNYIILAGYIAITLGMRHGLSQMQWALGPIIEEIGEEGFMEMGKRLYESKKLVTTQVVRFTVQGSRLGS